MVVGFLKNEKSQQVVCTRSGLNNFPTPVEKCVKIDVGKVSNFML